LTQILSKTSSFTKPEGVLSKLENRMFVLLELLKPVDLPP
jgi:hypothetical protein